MTIVRFLDIARGAVGLTQDDAAFRALCGPGETPERAAELARLSTCALFVRGCIAVALCGVPDPRFLSWRPPRVPPRLWAPYVIGDAMADLVATRSVAWSEALCHFADSTEARRALRPGAVVIVGTSGHEHVYIVESIERPGWPDGSIELVAIEAGQSDARGRQCVRRKRHEIDASGVDRTWGWPLPEGGPRATVPLPICAVGTVRAAEPEIRRPVTWVLDPRGLLE